MFRCIIHDVVMLFVSLYDVRIIFLTKFFVVIEYSSLWNVNKEVIVGIIKQNSW